MKIIYAGIEIEQVTLEADAQFHAMQQVGFAIQRFWRAEQARIEAERRQC